MIIIIIRIILYKFNLKNNYYYWIHLLLIIIIMLFYFNLKIIIIIKLMIKQLITDWAPIRIGENNNFSN